jgi:hypothetical protein
MQYDTTNRRIERRTYPKGVGTGAFDTNPADNSDGETGSTIHLCADDSVSVDNGTDGSDGETVGVVIRIVTACARIEPLT